MSWEDPRKVLSRHGVRPSRRHSQNFLTSQSVVERIADVIMRDEPKHVLEIGPGVGTLTGELLSRGARVVAIEKDPRMIEVLGAEFEGREDLRVEHADATRIALRDVTPVPCVVAGNLPYAITGMIMRRLVEQHDDVTRAVVMLQREVCDRLDAETGSKAYGVLTVFVRNVYDVVRICEVPPDAFHPPPKVHSAVISLRPRLAPLVQESEAFTKTVRAAFGQRRKTLRNALRASFEPEVVDAGLASLGIDPKRRGETLSISEFGQLAGALRGLLAEDAD